MKRRDFIKATAGLLLAPTIKLDLRYDPHVYLGRFVDGADCSHRYDLEAPFTQLGHVYATDARIMARIDSRLADEINGERRIPKAQECFDLMWKPREWRPMGEFKVLEIFYDCRACEARDCPVCGGVASYEDDIEFEICGTCMGRGYIQIKDCQVCGGTGSAWQPDVVDINGTLVDRRYVEKFCDIPGAAIAISEIDVVQWRADGIEGLLMGLDKDPVIKAGLRPTTLTI